MKCCRHCGRLVSAALVFACVCQGAKAPPSNAVSVILNAGPTSSASATVGGTWSYGPIVNMNNGKIIYDQAAPHGKLYVDVDKRPPPSRTTPTNDST